MCIRDRSGSASSTVTDANPKYVYPHLGDALGTLMPEAPTRTNYKFVGWNTKADGSGTTFTEDVYKRQVLG